jgi:hypothetical protein
MAAVLSKHLLGKISSNIIQIFGVWCALLVLIKKKKLAAKLNSWMLPVLFLLFLIFSYILQIDAV